VLLVSVWIRSRAAVSGAIARAARVAAAVTAVLCAAVLGWFLNEWVTDEQVVVSADRPVRVYAPETVVAGRIPNVVGLSEEEAQRALGDAGVELSDVSVHDVPYVGPESLVVRQSPPSGQPVGKGAVVLAVSAPAAMPDLDGSSESEARASLAELGAVVTLVDQYQPGAAEGTVLSTDPPSGEPIAGRVTLHVAEPLSSVFLTELEPVASTCRTGVLAVIAGTTQSEAIVCLPEHGAVPRGVTYALGGDVESFEAELGLDDRGDPDVPVAIRVYADGELVLSRRLAFGESLPSKVPLLGKLQLSLKAVAAGVAEPGALPVRAAFGEPRLVGSRSAIDRISEGLAE
jgi:hypothetical protein